MPCNIRAYKNVHYFCIFQRIILTFLKFCGKMADTEIKVLVESDENDKPPK